MNAVTQNEQQQEWIPEIERSDAGNRLPVAQQFVKDIGITGAEWRVLVDQIFPSAKSIQAIAMALTYCKVRKLDIFKRPVHIVPMWNSALGRMVETVWPGISELRTTAARTGEYAGIDEVVFGPEKTITFKDTIEKWVKVEGQSKKQKKPVEVEKTVTYPEWASVIIYRMVKGTRCAFHAKVFWQEAYATVGGSDVPNDMWESRPFGQVDKCVEAAALRKAFPEELGNEYAAEEMHGKVLPPDVAGAATPEASQAPKPPKPPAPPSQQIEHSETVDAETGEISEEVAEAVNEGEFDAAAFFDELETNLAGAMDEATVEEVWSEMDAEGQFDGDDINLQIAAKIKQRRLSQIGGDNG